MAGLNIRTLLSGLLLLLSVSSALCNRRIYATTSPGTDVFLEVGQTLELNCSVHIKPTTTTTTVSPGHTIDQPANISAHDTLPVLSVYNISMRKENVALPENLFTYYEADLTLQLHLENVTMEDAGWYSCYYNNKSKAFKSVSVGEMPGKPTNITCISDNFFDLTCHVTLSEQNGTIPFKWQLEFKTDRRGITVNCSRSPGQSLELLCVLPTALFGQYENYIVTAIGTAENTLRSGNVTASFDVYTGFNIVRPAVVRDLKVEEVNSSFVMATWQYPEFLDPNSPYMILKYQIVVEAEQGWDSRKLSFVHKARVQPEQLALPGLVCNAGYRLAVRSQPENASGDIYWSSWSNTTFHTTQTRPEKSTELSDGGFFMLEEKNNIRVVLYWKNPPEQFQCGNIVSYLVEWTQISSANDRSVTIETTPQRSGFELSTLAYSDFHNSEQLLAGIERIPGAQVYQVLDTTFSGGDEYELSMYVVNSVGQSYTASQTVLPSWHKARHARASWVSVEMLEGRARVAWPMDKQHCHLVDNVTYYWCSPDLDKSLNQSYVSCKDNLDWEHVSVEDACEPNHFWINSTDGDMSSMRFAVSVSIAGTTGGMVWEKYRFKTYDAVPATPQLSLAPGKTSTRELDVQVLYRDNYNVEEGGRPDTLQLVYMVATDVINTCQQVYANPDAIQRHSSVDFSHLGLTISGLQPDTSYAVCARFANRCGSGGFAKLQTIKTTADAPSYVWIAVVFGVLGAVIIGIIFTCVYRRFKKRVSQNRRVFVPDIISPQDTIARYTPNGSVAHLTLTTETKLQKPSGHDSGKGSDSPGSSYSGDNKESEGDGHYQEVDIKESTPILARSTKALEASSSSGLSGYLKVSNYGQAVSEEDLLSCLEDDDDGEHNASFSHSQEEGTFQMVEKKPRIYHKITLDDISMKHNSEEDACVLEDEINVEVYDTARNGNDDTTDVDKGGALPMSVTVLSELPTNVGNTDNTVTDLTNGMYCSDSVAASSRLAQDMATQGTADEESDNGIGEPAEPYKALEYSQVTVVAENNAKDASAKIDSDKLDKFNSEALESESNNAENQDFPAMSSEKFIDEVAENTPEENVETDINDIFILTDQTGESVDPYQDEFDTETDMIANQYNPKLDGYTMSNYQNPDVMSLGQGSILSFETDTSREDSRSIRSREDSQSIRSVTSPERTPVMIHRTIPETETSVLDMCNEINSEFVKIDTDPGNYSVDTEKKSYKDNTKATDVSEQSVGTDKKSYKDGTNGMDESEPDMGKLKSIEEFGKDTNRERSKAESVKTEGRTDCNSGDAGVNSYVRAAVHHS